MKSKAGGVFMNLNKDFGLTVKIKKLTGSAKLPCYAHTGDAGIDFFSDEEKVIKSKETVMISTGISMEIPQGYVGLVWDRSGLAVKNSLTCLAGVVDSGYRGEIKIVIHNLNNQDFKVDKGMKIAQMLIQPVIIANLEESEELADSQRQHKGFGSTGL